MDGNHENFDMLNSLPVAEFCSGKVHKVDDGIYHLMRGEVYTIDNKKIFAFGGASSHDKEYRTEGKNWWAEEMPSNEEYKKAEMNILAHNFEFDYIITHAAPTSIQEIIEPKYEKNYLTAFLEETKLKLKYKKWFFGHYHKDKQIDEKHFAMYNTIISV